jgi:hypothetical protein
VVFRGWRNIATYKEELVYSLSWPLDARTQHLIKSRTLKDVFISASEKNDLRPVGGDAPKTKAPRGFRSVDAVRQQSTEHYAFGSANRYDDQQNASFQLGDTPHPLRLTTRNSFNCDANSLSHITIKKRPIDESTGLLHCNAKDGESRWPLFRSQLQRS